MWDAGTWSLPLRRGDVRLGTRGGEKQKEPFSASNEYTIQFPGNPRALARGGGGGGGKKQLSIHSLK